MPDHEVFIALQISQLVWPLHQEQKLRKVHTTKKCVFSQVVNHCVIEYKNNPYNPL